MTRSENCVLAVDAGGTFLKAALVTNDGIFVEDSFIRVPVDSNGSAASISNAYIQLAAFACEKARRQNLSLSAVGVCIPGPFDYKNGTSLMTHKYASIQGLSIRPWLQEGAGNIPVTFLHDSHAFLLGAVWNSDYDRYQRIAGVIIGTGLGFASFFGGAIFTNAQGGPGISIFAKPYKNSTSEEYVSRRAILTHYRALATDTSEALDVIDIANLARQGQPQAVSVFKDLGSDLAAILHDILSTNRFECLVLGGAISKSADLFLPELQKDLSDLPVLSHIGPTANIDMAPILGSARAALFQG